MIVPEPPGRRVFHGPRDYLDLARSGEATADELRELARSEYVFVRQAVAENPKTPPDALRAVLPDDPVTWNDFTLLATVARHPAATEALLREIGARVSLEHLHDRNPDRPFAAAIALFEQPNTPDDLLLGFLDDAAATTQFRKVAARQTSHDAVIDKLLTDRSETVRRAAERRRQPGA